MSKGTEPITYHYDVDGKDVAVTRKHVRTAYARNGNAGNPTEYFVWSVTVDGEYVLGSLPTRAIAYEYGRAKAQGVEYRYHERWSLSVGVRNYSLVADEMKAHYRSREVIRDDT